MKGTWQTDNHGSGILLLVVVVAVIAAAAAGPVVHAAEDLVRILLIAAGVLAVAAVAAIAGLLAWHKRRTPPHWTVQVQPPARAPQRAVQAPAAAQRSLPPQIHLHLHGPVSAADVAELIARQGNPQPAAIEENK